MQWGVIILSIVLIIIFLVSAGLLTQASTKIGPNNTDSNLSRAYKITTWISVLTWVILLLIILGLALYFWVYAEEAPEVTALNYYNQIKEQPQSLGIFLSLFLFIVMLLILVVGIFSVMAAIDISRYSGYKTSADIYRAYEDCAISAVLCLSAFGITIGIILYYHYSSYNNQRQLKDIKNSKDVKNVEDKDVVKEIIKDKMINN